MPISVTRREQEVPPDKEGVVRGKNFTVIQVNGNTIISDGCGWSVTVDSKNDVALYTDQGEIKVTTEN